MPDDGEADSTATEMEVVRVGVAEDQTLRRLLEFYFHDMAEWFQFDQHPHGGYVESTEEYWREDRDVYFLNLRGLPIGFGIVGAADGWKSEAGARDMTEFFVVRRHRRAGVGKAFASHLWGLYPGSWLVRVYQANQPALPFWRRAVAEYSAGRYEEQIVSRQGKNWSYFVFESPGGR